MRYALAGLAYALLAASIFSNLLPVASTHIYSDVGDPLLNASILGWNATHVPLTEAWWNFPAFAPLSGVTAWTEHLLGAYPLATPIIWATGNPLLAYNLLLVACFPLNGLAMFALAREVTRSDAGAFVAGLAFAFAPYQSGQISHLQMLMAFGMPLALLGLHQQIDRGGLRGVAWFALGWPSAILSSAYALVFFPLLVALWCLWFARPGGRCPQAARRLLPLAGVAVATMILIAPLLWGYHVRQSAYGFERGYGDVKTFSADIAGLAGISHRQGLWRGILDNTLGEAAIFPGLGIAVFAACGLGAHLRRGAGAGRAARYCLVGAAVCAALGLARTWAGPSGWHVGTLMLPALRAFRVFTLGALLLLAGLFGSDRFRRAWEERNAVVFYVAAAGAMWLLAIGPEPSWSGVRVLTYGPFWLLMHVPGGSSIRVAARAWQPAVACLAVAAGAGAAWLVRRPRLKWAAVALAALVVAEGWFSDGAAALPPAVWAGLIPSGAMVLDLPMASASENVPAEYRAVVGGYRAINGYSGYEPAHFKPLAEAFVLHRAEAFDAFRRLGDVYVIVRPVIDDVFRNWMESQPGAQRLFVAPEWALYRLPRIGGGATVPLPLPRREDRAFDLR